MKLTLLLLLAAMPAWAAKPLALTAKDQKRLATQATKILSRCNQSDRGMAELTPAQIKNKTDEHIDKKTLTDLINSGLNISTDPTEKKYTLGVEISSQKSQRGGHHTAHYSLWIHADDGKKVACEAKAEILKTSR